MPPEPPDPEAIKPSKTANTQNHCPLFKLAAETRNEIYALVFAVETMEDGSIELDDTPASSTLTRTCQQIYNESRLMHKAAHHDYPTNTFTLNVRDRQHVCVPALKNAFFHRLNSVQINWRADEHNKGEPLRFTSHFTWYINEDHSHVNAKLLRSRVELHDE
jgi:hypothetical protein